MTNVPLPTGNPTDTRSPSADAVQLDSIFLEELASVIKSFLVSKSTRRRDRTLETSEQ